MTLEQIETLRRLTLQAEAAENLRDTPKVEVTDAYEWDDVGCIGVTVWAGGVGAPMLIDRDGDLCDPEEGPGHPVRLVVVSDKYDSLGRNRFSYEAAA